MQPRQDPVMAVELQEEHHRDQRVERSEERTAGGADGVEQLGRAQADLEVHQLAREASRFHQQRGAVADHDAERDLADEDQAELPE